MAINVDVLGNTQPLEAAVQSAVNRIRRRPIKITVDDKGATQPLGNMRRSADEFSKSMEAANARIIAFGASMAIINGVADAFKGMVRNVVEVEKALADINVVMGLSAQNLERFSDGLFTVAKETGQAFRIAADAATEYARQGLSMEESLKRTKDALILTRLTGMDSANAVKSLTAAMNTYGNQIKDTTQLVSKFAAVDVKFAVSAEDFADAIARTGAAAKGAGVDIDELIGLVTAAQQQTARGGKVIGNSFKTIFTRIGRTDTLNQLENLGIAVRDIEGNTLGAKRILTDLANTFDSLTEAQKAQIAQTVGGVFQINVLKAVLGDAAKQNGILANATQISAGATDEAITKNEQLRQTMAAMATETGLAIKEVSAKIGEIALAPGMEKILNYVKIVAEGANNLLGDGESAGNKFANGFLKGLGNIITGPGLVVIVAVFGKLFLKAAQYARESLTSLIGVTTEAQKQKAIQTSLVNLFGQNAALSKEMLRTDISRTEKEKIILALLKAQVAEANTLNAISKQAASTLYRQGFGPNLAPRRGRAEGHIPNFAEREQAAKGGYAAGNIRTMNMPGQGSVIYNSAEKVKNFAGMKQPAIMPPLSSKAGKNYQQAFGSVHGFDPYAGSGFVPNFNKAKTKPMEGNALINRILADGQIDLSSGEVMGNLAQGLGVILGVGPEGFSDKKYSQSYSSLSKSKTLQPGSPQFKLASIIARRSKMSLAEAHKQLSFRNPSVSSTLKTGSVLPVSQKDIKEFGEEAGGMMAMKKMVDPPLNQAVRKIAQKISIPFQPKGRSMLMPNDLWSKNSQGTKANDLIGTIAEMAIRGGLNTIIPKAARNAETDAGGAAGAAFDFTGSHADKISEIFDAGGILAYEMKLRSSTAAGKSGGIPKKVINYKIPYAADGYIPNFANPLADAINREKGAGVPVSQIRVGSHQALMNKGNPLGLGVTNTTDEPNGLRDVFGANGYVPNYFISKLRDKIADSSSGQTFIKEAAKATGESYKKLSKIIDDLAKNKKLQQNEVKKLKQQLARETQGSKAYIAIQKQLSTAQGDLAKTSQVLSTQQRNMQRMQQARGGGAVGMMGRASGRMGRMFSGNAGMAMMMGAPMAAGFLQSGGPGQTGAGAAAYAAGGGLTGAASGGMMAAMVAPFFGPAAPLVIGVGALIGGVKGLVGAMDENTDALNKKRSEEFTEAAAKRKAETNQRMDRLFQNDLIRNQAVNTDEIQGSIKVAGRRDNEKYFKKLATAKEKANERIYEELLGAALQTPEAEKALDVLGAKLQGTDLDEEGRALFDTDADDAIVKILNKEIEIKGGETEKTQKARETLKSILASVINLSKDVELSDFMVNPEIISANFKKVFGDQADKIKTLNDSVAFFANPKIFEGKTADTIDAKKVAAGQAAIKNFARQMYADDTKYIDSITGAEKLGSEIRAEIDKDLRSDGTLAGQAAAISNAALKSQSIKNADDAQVRGVIIEMNKQKVLLEMQSEAIASQKTINQTYQRKAIQLAKEEKMLGRFMSEEAKARLENIKNLNKNNQKFALGEQAAKDKRDQAIVSDIFSSDNQSLLQKVKTIVAQNTNLSGDKINRLEISKYFASLTSEQRKQLLMSEEFKEVQEDVNDILTIREEEYNNEISKLENTRDLANQRVNEEGKTNVMLGKRADILDKLIDAQKELQDTANFEAQMAAINKRIAAAQFKSPDNPNNRGLFRSQQEVLDFDFAQAEKEMIKSDEVRKAEFQTAMAKTLEEQNLPVAEDIDLTDFDAIRAAAKAKQIQINKKEANKIRTDAVKLPDVQAAAEFLRAEKLQESTTGDITKNVNDTITAQERLNNLQKVKNDATREELILREKILKYKRGEALAGDNRTGMSRGIADGIKSMKDQVQYMDYELGKNIPGKLADGLATAMTEAANGAKNIGDALEDAALNFLSYMQQAMMQKLAMQVVGGLFSQGGAVRKYSSGGNVPAMVTNGEYVMGREAVKKYGGGFMHSLNARGKIPNYSMGGDTMQEYGMGKIPKYTMGGDTMQEYGMGKIPKYTMGGDTMQEYGMGKIPYMSRGGEPGSALAANFGGGESFISGRNYQSRAMSGFFYSGLAGNVGLQEDAQEFKGILQKREEERRRREMERQAKKAKRRKILGMIGSIAASYALGSIFSSTGPSAADTLGKVGPEGFFKGGKDSLAMAMPESSFSFGSEQFDTLKNLDVSLQNPFSVSTSPMFSAGSTFSPYTLKSKFLGGKINKYAAGGMIYGKSGIDQIPAMLSEGEYVIKASSARQMGKPMLDKINAGKFYEGGSVSPEVQKEESSVSGGQTNNISINIKMDASGNRQESSQNQEDSGGDMKKQNQGGELGKKIKDAVVGVIIEEKRPGGLLSEVQ